MRKEKAIKREELTKFLGLLPRILILSTHPQNV